MSVPLKFKIPISVLAQDGGYILNAVEAHAADINPRLKDGHVVKMRALYTGLGGKIADQKSAKSNVGELTQAQNDALADLLDRVGKARKSAGLAFKGHDVKLHNEFQIGNNGGKGLGDILQMARIIQASCAVPANAATLAENGWIAADTAALKDSIEKLDTTDDTQEASKGEPGGATDKRNTDLNDFYDGVLKIQNAADIQYPDRNPADAPVRVEFRLGLFPPKRGRGGASPTPPAPPTSPPA